MEGRLTRRALHDDVRAVHDLHGAGLAVDKPTAPPCPPHPPRSGGGGASPAHTRLAVAAIVVEVLRPALAAPGVRREATDAALRERNDAGGGAGGDADAAVLAVGTGARGKSVADLEIVPDRHLHLPLQAWEETVRGRRVRCFGGPRSDGFARSGIKPGRVVEEAGRRRRRDPVAVVLLLIHPVVSDRPARGRRRAPERLPAHATLDVEPVALEAVDGVRAIPGRKLSRVVPKRYNGAKVVGRATEC